MRQSNYRLRPKAVTLTLFTRLFLADWFVHGIGGALYESITDHILEEYYKIKGLRFGVSTTTMTLPLLERTNSTTESIAELKRSLQKAKHNPERFINEYLINKEPVNSLLTEKKRLVQTAKEHSLPPETRKSAFISIFNVNKKLAKYAGEKIQSLDEKIKLVQNCIQSERVLNYREYFFGLFPEEILKGMTQKIISG